MNKLELILKEQDIEQADVTKLVEAFGGPFKEAGEIIANYKKIEVTSEDQKELMAEARDKRLTLKKARTTVENKRKELKTDIVKQGRAIDSVARYVKEEIEPAEKYLEEQEKFAELRAAERAATLKAERIEKLVLYTDDVSLYNLDDMSDIRFDALLDTLKKQHEQEVAEAKRIEDERIAKVKAEQEEQERIRKENEKLKAEAEAKEKAEQEERKKRQAEEDARLAAEQKEREEREAEQAKKDAEAQAERNRIQKEADEKVKLERARVEKLQEAQREREQADAQAKATAEEAERAALLAPDKEKLISFAQGLDRVRTEKMPAVKTKQAQDILNEVELKMSQLFNLIMDKAKEL